MGTLTSMGRGISGKEMLGFSRRNQPRRDMGIPCETIQRLLPCAMSDVI